MQLFHVKQKRLLLFPIAVECILSFVQAEEWHDKLTSVVFYRLWRLFVEID